MANLAVVDDDYASEILTEQLGFRGHDVRRFASASEALANIDAIASSDMLILDIIMPSTHLFGTGQLSGSRNAGLHVFQAIRKARPRLPILAYSATADND